MKGDNHHESKTTTPVTLLVEFDISIDGIVNESVKAIQMDSKPSIEIFDIPRFYCPYSNCNKTTSASLQVERTTVQKVESYEIGDRIQLTLKNGESIRAMTVQKDSDGMVFIFVDCLATEYPINKQDTNKGGYEMSNLRGILNHEILDLFPAGARNVLKPFTNGDFLRLPTEKEIFGENRYDENEHDSVKQFEPMKQRHNRIAAHGNSDDWRWYWLQNHIVSSDISFINVDSYGHVGINPATYVNGVRPCFKL